MRNAAQRDRRTDCVVAHTAAHRPDRRLYYCFFFARTHRYHRSADLWYCSCKSDLLPFQAKVYYTWDLSIQGICTYPKIGSQVNPKLCSKPISAAYSICLGVPPHI